METALKPPGEWRKNDSGEYRLLSEAEGYVMVRHGAFVPVVMSREAWDAIPLPDTYNEASIIWAEAEAAALRR